MPSEPHKLDQPLWNSLVETHKSYALDFESYKFYNPEYCPFGSYITQHSEKGLQDFTALTNDFYVVGNPPVETKEISLEKHVPCYQMILEQPIEMEITQNIVTLETATQKQELLDLVNLVQPGYFKNKTVELGAYFGIYKNGALVAVTGERMKMNDFTEISAVVTHPDHTGNGYAKQLLKRTADHIQNEGKTPYLHVAQSNTGAVKLYEKRGFVIRKPMDFWHMKCV